MTIRPEIAEQTAERIAYARRQLDAHDFNYEVKNHDIGQIVVSLYGIKFVFYARTGKVTGKRFRGITNFVNYLETYRANLKKKAR